ncbi:MAG: hypothetical protein K8R36_21025, partial [Planctomycetales bacterium]|nr:hypothetical protein [Planctomycetales bacterium]
MFDPYQTWLGIPRQEQPPHHYRLLGITPLEEDPAVIEAAAERQTKLLQREASGPHMALAYQLCGEVAAARHCLATPAAKSAYDKRLASSLRDAPPAPVPSPPVHSPPIQSPPVAPPPAAPSAHRTPTAPPAPLRPVPIPQQQSTPATADSALPAFVESPGTKPILSPNGALTPRRTTDHSQGDAVGKGAIELVKIIAGGAAGLIIALLILNAVGVDLLGLNGNNQKKSESTKKVAAAKTPTVGRSTSSRIRSSPSGPPGSGDSEPADPFDPDNVPPPAPSDNENKGGDSDPSQPSKRPPSLPSENGAADEERSLAELTQSKKTKPAKKLPFPSAAEQASKLTAIHDIYKDEFAAAKPGATAELVKFLLSAAAKLEDDPVARYVLCLEAFRQACAGGDFVTAAETLDKLETEYESEPFAPRYELLSKLAAAAKTGDERAIAAKSALLLMGSALSLGKIEEADKLARIADAQTKSLPDKELRARAAAALQTTSELLQDLKNVAPARQKLAQSPDDPAANLAVGRNSCLIDGSWDAGLAHLAKGSDEALQGAAAMDLAGPSEAISAGKIGDVWYDLAKEGKGQSFFARADYWYQKGMQAESGLALIRLRKRHEEILGLRLPPRILAGPQQPLTWPTAKDLVLGDAETPQTDLFALVNPQAARPLQGWTKNGGAWTTPPIAQDAYAFFESSTQPPRRAYSLQARVTRKYVEDSKGNPAGFVMFGLTHKGNRFALVLDEVLTAGARRAYLTMGNAGESQNSSVVYYTQMKVQANDIVCNVADDKITVLIDGEKLLQYSGDMSLLALPPNAKYPPSKPFFYAQQCGINVI